MHPKRPAAMRLHVLLTPSDEVQALRARIAALEGELKQLREQYNRTEFLYRCETLINLQLQDLCREQQVKVPRRLFQRPLE